MCFGGGGNAGDARAAESARQEAIKQGQYRINKAFEGFDDNWYANRANEYTAWANPQLDQQYSKAKDTLINNLARAGLLQSSVGAKRIADLGQEYSNYKTEIAAKGFEAANSVRQSVENSRTDLTNQLYSIADPEASGQAAIARAQMASAQPTYSPLSIVFQNASALAAQDATNRAYGQPGIFSSIFGSKNNSTKVVN